MGIINDFFDGIYCINLDQRVDRWEMAQKEFTKLGLSNVNRFSAIKHEKGSIGCRESHLKVINEAKKNNFKNVLIFEDDIKTIGDLSHIENSLSQLSNIEWDLFYLGATVDPNVGKLTKISEHLVRTNFAYTTHAYAINSQMFDYILDNAPYNPIIDVFYCKNIVPRGKSFIINPMVCIQQESYSDIEKHNTDYYWMLDFFKKTLKKK